MKKSYYIKSFLIFVFLIALDQVTKYLSFIQLKNKESINLIPKVLQLTYLENRGAAFGLLQNKQVFFVIFTLIIAVFLIIVFYRIAESGRMPGIPAAILVLLAGAVGNFIDRVLHGYVIDFIYLKLIDFPVFNIADCYVTISVVVLCILLLFVYKDEEQS